MRKYIKVGFFAIIIFFGSASFSISQEIIAKHKLTETQVKSLKTLKHSRPLIIIVADNAGTETTDLMIPYGILKSSGLFDVKIAAPSNSKISLMPALNITPDASFEDFENEHPEGADIVIIPAIHNKNSKLISEFVARQSLKGSFSISICEGAWVLAKTNIPNNNLATTHWFAMRKIANSYKNINWISNVRYIGGDNYITTSGISASLPISIALIEVFGGTNKAMMIANNYGLSDWSNNHKSSDFKFEKTFYGPIVRNTLAFWSFENLYIDLENGFDELILAINADAWSRTYKSKFFVHCTDGSVISKNKLNLICDKNIKGKPISLAKKSDGTPFEAVLIDIENRYGAETSFIVKSQLEYQILR